MKKTLVLSCIAVLGVFFISVACNPLAPSTPTATVEILATETQVLPEATATDTPFAANPPVSPEESTSTPEEPGPAITHIGMGETINITFIDMVSVSDGWGVGGVKKASDHVFRTSTAGVTWKDVTPPEPVPPPGDVVTALGYFKDASTAWVVYGPDSSSGVPDNINVWVTHDAGSTWQSSPISTADATGAFMPSFLTFADAQHGWLMVILGGGMNHEYVAIYATSDGGVTWTRILDPYSDSDIQSFAKTDFAFVDANNGWLTRDANGVDQSPHVFHTTDGGKTWIRIDLPAPAKYPNLFNNNACGTYNVNRFSPDFAVFTLRCLDTATYKVQINFQYATQDAGKTWQVLPLPADFAFDKDSEGLYYFDPTHGFALGKNFYQTNDGGVTWTLIKKVAWDGQFSFPNMNLGWAVASSGNKLALVTTTNGGAKWSVINPFVVP